VRKVGITATMATETDAAVTLNEKKRVRKINF